jgi:hypothetical protein
VNDCKEKITKLWRNCVVLPGSLALLPKVYEMSVKIRLKNYEEIVGVRSSAGGSFCSLVVSCFDSCAALACGARIICNPRQDGGVSNNKMN